MTIVIEPLGGLGNQLFIYALGLRLARQLETDLVCDTWNFWNYSWHVYELDTFKNSIVKTYSSRLRQHFGHKGRSLIRKGQALPLMPRRFGRLILEKSSVFDPDILNARDGSRLNGYFQSPKYFSPIAHEIRRQVMSPVRPSEWMNETRRRLDRLGAWTAVHVRRGNYTYLPSMGLVNRDYYSAAIQLLDSLAGERQLVFFSDSPELLPELTAQFGARASQISPPPGVRAIDVMQVMSDARSLIIGNSTFSWWASFLQDYPDRTVIAPRPWLDDPAFNERDLLLPHWITIGRELSQD